MKRVSVLRRRSEGENFYPRINRLVTLSVCLIIFLFCVPFPAQSGVYKNSIETGASWLAGQQNLDGSWGTGAIQHLYTAEVASALGSTFRESGSHAEGINWLWNHFPTSLDFRARRISVLAVNGSDSTFVSSLTNEQQSNGGWGLSSAYGSSPQDTALVLQALAVLNDIDEVGVQPGLDYLISSKISGSGWALSPEPGNTTMEPIGTAMVLKALTAFSGKPGVSTPLSEAVTVLENAITISDSSLVKAHTALALLTNNMASAKGQELLNSFAQSPDGSWSQDIYLTSLILQSMAIVENLGQNLNNIVPLADAELQEVINASLNKNRSDVLKKGDLVQIASLDLSGANISSLSGLNEATNLSDLTIDVKAKGYVGTSSGIRFAGVLSDLGSLPNGLDVTVNLSGSLDDTEDDVYIILAVEEIHDDGAGTLTPAIRIKGKNLYDAAITPLEPKVEMADLPVLVLDRAVIGSYQEVVVSKPTVAVDSAYRIELSNAKGRSEFETEVKP